MADGEIIKSLKIRSGKKILDVGGSMMQHTEIKVDTIVDLIRPEDSPYNPSKLLAKHFVKLDITRDKFPFKDKEFDVVLCTHTLEDLPTPFPVMEEIQRVGKRGLIATPTMGSDMAFGPIDYTGWITGARRMPGEAHHRWFIVKEGKKLKIIPKIYPVLYTPQFQIIKWDGEREMVYFWKDKIEYEEFPGFNIHAVIDEYKKFMKENRRHIRMGKSAFFVDNPLNLAKALTKLLLKKGVGYKHRRGNL